MALRTDSTAWQTPSESASAPALTQAVERFGGAVFAASRTLVETEPERLTVEIFRPVADEPASPDAVHGAFARTVARVRPPLPAERVEEAERLLEQPAGPAPAWLFEALGLAAPATPAQWLPDGVVPAPVVADEEPVEPPAA